MQTQKSSSPQSPQEEDEQERPRHYLLFQKTNKREKGSLAPSKGFGPLTDWLTASRSTGLSHDGTLLTAFDFKYTI
jgi:hypothetical protein